MQDLRYVIRTLSRSRGFTILMATTFALGLGANTAVFSLLDRVFLRAPPGIQDPDEVQRVFRVGPPEGPAGLVGPQTATEVRSVFSYPEFRAITTAAPGVAISGYASDRERLGRGDDAIQAELTLVAGDYFALLGIRPARGRFFSPAELEIGAVAPVAIIGFQFWQRRFAGDPNVIGKQVEIDHHFCTVIGVTQADFHGSDNNATDVWIPMNALAWLLRNPNWYEGSQAFVIRILARTPDSRSLAMLASAVTVAVRQGRAASVATARGVPTRLMDPPPGALPPDIRIATLLSAVSLIILLVGCANVANLLLMRGMHRRREVAVRLALGVSRGRLMALLVSESVVGSLAGAALGVGIAAVASTLLRRTIFPEINWVDAPVDARVVLFSALLASVVGLATAIVPAWQTSRQDLTSALQGGGRDGVWQRSRIRTTLLVVQTALSVVLLAGAGLFVVSLRNLEAINIGYDASRVVLALYKSDPDVPVQAASISARITDLAGRFQQISGVEAVGLSASAPMSGAIFLGTFLPGQGSALRIDMESPSASFVSPGYLNAVGIRVLKGRGLTSSDRFGATSPVLVSETMARRVWPAADAIGQCLILLENTNGCSTVVGIVADAHAHGIVEERPPMQFYVPLPDTGQQWRASVIALRVARGTGPAVSSTVRRELNESFGGAVDFTVQPMTERLAPELRPWHAGAVLFTGAGALALLVAMIGVYSSISYTLTQRTHELGVRIALGATAGRILRVVVIDSLGVVVVGVAVGLVVSLVVGRALAPMLYRTPPHNPVVLGVVAIALAIVAIIAAVVPATRALKTDPVAALRAR